MRGVLEFGQPILNTVLGYIVLIILSRDKMSYRASFINPSQQEHPIPAREALRHRCQGMVRFAPRESDAHRRPSRRSAQEEACLTPRRYWPIANRSWMHW
jgi:hypothetical protein